MADRRVPDSAAERADAVWETDREIHNRRVVGAMEGLQMAGIFDPAYFAHIASVFRAVPQVQGDVRGGGKRPDVGKKDRDTAGTD